VKNAPPSLPGGLGQLEGHLDSTRGGSEGARLQEGSIKVYLEENRDSDVMI
jgi:hypothetical protein